MRRPEIAPDRKRVGVGVVVVVVFWIFWVGRRSLGEREWWMMDALPPVLWY